MKCFVFISLRFWQAPWVHQCGTDAQGAITRGTTGEPKWLRESGEGAATADAEAWQTNQQSRTRVQRNVLPRLQVQVSLTRKTQFLFYSSRMRQSCGTAERYCAHGLSADLRASAGRSQNEQTASVCSTCCCVVCSLQLNDTR